jgi:hypothetical protein
MFLTLSTTPLLLLLPLLLQSVESPALAMVVPLLLRGLRVTATATKRQSAVIIENMSKLVDDPADAAPFLPLLMPALETAAANIADPEARAVADRAYAQLVRLDGLCKASVPKTADPVKVAAALKDAAPGLKSDAFTATTADYIVNIACSLMGLRKVAPEDWSEVRIRTTNPSYEHFNLMSNAFWLFSSLLCCVMQFGAVYTSLCSIAQRALQLCLYSIEDACNLQRNLQH